MNNLFIFRRSNGIVRLHQYLGDSTKVVVPSEYKGYPIDIIRQDCFYDSYNGDEIQEIILPDSIYLIENYAFCGCLALEKITLPQELELIKSFAFGECENLKEITLPKSVEKLGTCCFYGCSSLTKIIALNEDIILGKDAIPWGLPLEEVSFHLIPKLDFLYQIKLITNLLNKWDNLTKKEHKEIITFINRKQNLKKHLLLYSDNDIIVLLIGEKIKITLMSLNEYLEFYIEKANTIIIAVLLEYKEKNFTKKQVEDIKDRKELVDIGFEFPTFGEFKHDWRFTKRDNKIVIYGYKGLAKKQTIPVTLNDNTPIVKIAKNDNTDFTKLEVLVIEAQITEIEYLSFANCVELKEIILPESLVDIGRYVFKDCRSLTEIILPESVQNIKDYTFKYCTSLKKINMPKNLSWIGDEAFKNCKALEQIILPPNLQYIDEGAFSGCENLKEISIPKSVAELGRKLFKGCTNLKKVEILGTIQEIEILTFANCTNLKEIILPNTLISINEWAFENCTSLEELTIPASVSSISYGVFDGCISLKQVNFLGEVPPLGICDFIINKV